MGDDLCICGSGRLFALCHGLRGRARRGRGLELRVLGELHDLAFLFSFVRPRGAAVAAFADRVAQAMGDDPRDTSPAEAAEGVALLSVDERRRLVRSWADRYPERWARICRHVGDAPLAEATLVASAVRGAVADRLGPRLELVAELEEGTFEESPALAVALVVSPESVWSYEEILGGQRVMSWAHVERTRAQARRLARRLPFDGLPRASATLLEGCDLVADDHVARKVAGLLFDKYGLLARVRSDYVSLRN